MASILQYRTFFAPRETRGRKQTGTFRRSSSGLDLVSAWIGHREREDRRQDMRRLEDMAISSIAPRIPGLRLRMVAGFPDGPVLVLRIPRSWLAPHMVSYKRSGRFYSRTSSGKYQMDVDEIRRAFVASEAVPDRIRRLRDDGLRRIAKGETPVPWEAPGVVIALHPSGTPAEAQDVLPPHGRDRPIR